jgi:Tol biopolymer transport system component
MAGSSITWSPDGQWIAFAGGIPETQRLDIFIIKPDGTGLKRMTNSSQGEAGLSWSPNGKFIMYSYTSSTSTFPESDLALLDVDKAQTYLLTSTKGSEHRPTWSPDGKQIAYLFDQGNSPSELWVMDFETKSTERILVDVPVSNRKIDWSPDGQWIAFISPGISDYCGDIYVVRPDGSNTTRLTNLTGCATVVIWSPDGKYLAFVGKDKPMSQGWRIYIMDVESKNIIPVTDEEELRIDDIDWTIATGSK